MRPTGETFGCGCYPCRKQINFLRCRPATPPGYDVAPSPDPDPPTVERKVGAPDANGCAINMFFTDPTTTRLATNNRILGFIRAFGGEALPMTGMGLGYRRDIRAALHNVKFISDASSKSGARQFLEGLKEACGKIRCQRSLRQKVSRHIRASSPIWVQNWPGRLNRH